MTEERQIDTFEPDTGSATGSKTFYQTEANPQNSSFKHYIEITPLFIYKYKEWEKNYEYPVEFYLPKLQLLFCP